MHEIVKPVLSVLSGQGSPSCPVWFMRQAGRYLPEYRELRKKADSFVSFCLTPDLATEATLQSLERFDLDAAILFADILLVPEALGRPVSFTEGEGPRLKPIEELKEIMGLSYDNKKLEPVYQTIGQVRPKLKKHQTMIGFCGGLWTVSCYMIEGRGQTDFSKARRAAEGFPEILRALQDKLFMASLDYLLSQIEAGAEVIQIFESHAGQLSGKAFHDFIIDPTRRLIEGIRAKYPAFPIIGFPRGASEEDYEAYFRETGITCCGIDQNISLSFVENRLLPVGPVQGNLDPEILIQGGEIMVTRAKNIIDALGGKLVFNLGHGIYKETPPEHVDQLIKTVRAYKKRGP